MNLMAPFIHNSPDLSAGAEQVWWDGFHPKLRDLHCNISKLIYYLVKHQGFILDTIRDASQFKMQSIEIPTHQFRILGTNAVGFYFDASCDPELAGDAVQREISTEQNTFFKKRIM